MTTASLITGGAGFIGSNLAYRLLSGGERVLLLDNLSRPHVARNVAWLRECFGPRAELHVANVLDENAVRACVQQVDHVFHFAAQVAVTTSLTDPSSDFDVNARGTLNVLEAVRSRRNPPALFFTSTNKVYGDLARLSLSVTDRGYQPLAAELRQHGVREDAPLDFHSPYGCSKGCADQYVRDYARSFGIRSVVFRMSCIYGPRQFGTEDQGWVAHFMLRALRDEPIIVYGDGQQTRDLLFVSDLVDAFLAARDNLNACSGQAFNIGGGPDNCASVLSVLQRTRALTASASPLSFDGWRTGDQRYYVSDTRKFSRLTGWSPRVTVPAGLEQLKAWLSLVVQPEAGEEREPMRRPEPIDTSVTGATP
jgi:CDP-paratose 2-epimerase